MCKKFLTWKTMRLVYSVPSYMKNFFKAYGYIQNILFLSYQKRHQSCSFIPKLAVFPPIQQSFVSPDYFFHNGGIWHDWFLEGILPSSAALPGISVLQRTIQVFSECSGSIWEPCLSAELRPTTMGTGGGRSGELQWYSCYTGRAAPLGSKNFRQHFCLGY